jgi:hypothetical protein
MQVGAVGHQYCGAPAVDRGESVFEQRLAGRMQDQPCTAHNNGHGALRQAFVDSPFDHFMKIA